MLPAVHDPVHLVGEDGRQVPGIVVEDDAIGSGHVLAVRLDDGGAGPIGSAWALTWSLGADVFQTDAVVVERGLIDGVQAVGIHPQGEIRKIQRRQFVRVPIQRSIRVRRSPIPLEPDFAEVPTEVSGLTLDVAEASVRCSLRQKDAPAFGVGASVAVDFSVDGQDFALIGEITRCRPIKDADAPRVELVVMLDADESIRTALRRALFAEQVKLRELAR